MGVIPIVKMILRTWMKCSNPVCEHTWYDDGDNTFSGCPECGDDFEVLDMENIRIEKEYGRL